LKKENKLEQSTDRAKTLKQLRCSARSFQSQHAIATTSISLFACWLAWNRESLPHTCESLHVELDGGTHRVQLFS
jgi:hypothetical protein